MKKTKIICTIGPESESKSMIYKLARNGMDIARLNLSHGTYKEHYNRINNIRFISNKIKKYIPIILDTKGPEIRICKFKNTEKIFLKKNQIFILSSDMKDGDLEKVSVNYNNLYKYITKNSIILLNEGLIKIKVLEIKNEKIICKVLNSGFLEENKRVHIVKSELNIPYISNKDKNDIIFGCKNKVDLIALSFVRNYKDILLIKKFLNENNGNNILLISKIENKSSIKDIDNIIKESYSIMIARGDLGINIPLENVIIEQKKIINKCNINNKPVITATHMLESMINNRIPTRAEAGDIYNSILDGTDCVMLSGESAKGKYPIESVKIMKKICKKTDNLLKKSNKNFTILDIIEYKKLNSFKIIVVISNDYFLVTKIKNINNNSIIINITNNDESIKNLILVRCVICYKLENIILDNELIKKINTYIKKNNFLKINNSYLLIYSKNSKNINSISIIKNN